MNRLKLYNKIITTMQGRYGMYYKDILTDCNNNLNLAIRDLYNLLMYIAMYEIPNDLLYNKMVMQWAIDLEIYL